MTELLALEQIGLMHRMDEKLYQFEAVHKTVANLVLLDVSSWHKLQTLPDVPENHPITEGLQRGKYKGVDVLLITDPFYDNPTRKPMGELLMAGIRGE